MSKCQLFQRRTSGLCGQPAVLRPVVIGFILVTERSSRGKALKSLVSEHLCTRGSSLFHLTTPRHLSEIADRAAVIVGNGMYSCGPIINTLEPWSEINGIICFFGYKPKGAPGRQAMSMIRRPA